MPTVRTLTKLMVIETVPEANRSHGKLFSDSVLERRVKLVGHVFMLADDLVRQVSYQLNFMESYDVGKRGLGGPRQQWLFHGHVFNLYIGNEELRNCSDQQKTANLAFTSHSPSTSSPISRVMRGQKSEQILSPKV